MSASLSDLPPNIQSLVSQAKNLYKESFADDEDRKFCASAPGRVNLIGEHTDYTGGFVLPLAIGYNTVVYGRGCIVKKSSAMDAKKSRIVSTNNPVVNFHVSPDMTPLSSNDSWANYSIGVILQYLSCLKPNETFVIDMAIAGDVPLGSGLSSSASLEVATAVLLESIIHDNEDEDESMLIPSKEVKMERAIRCQRAENIFCNVPCGIMDQFVSSCGCDGKLLLIDCRSLDFREVSLGGGGGGEGESNNHVPVLVIANSNVKHNLGDSEYPIRVQQCKDATAILSKCNPQIKSLRDAKMEDIETAKSSGLEGVLLQRARHVVSENNRTIVTAEALESSKWELVGKLMNESHSSMRDDYETSCSEIDVLVELAKDYSGVYGSRLTGGGFGGCTVTLVAKDRAQGLIDHLKEEYKKKTDKQCDCFVTSPGYGARTILL